MSNTTIHGDELRCLNCGDLYKMALPASMRMSIAMMRTFASEHAGCRKSPAGLARMKFSTPEEWLKSWDTGNSAMAIWNTMMGRGSVKPDWVPHDPSDFGRCFRLLKAFPDWRARLSEMNKHPAWQPFVGVWRELERLFVEESPSGQCPKLFDALKACRIRLEQPQGNAR